MVVANDSSRLYGQPNYPLTASYYGFVNGDTPASLTSPAIVATLANQLSPVGTYGIAVAGATSPNYAITFLAGTLTVLPTPAGATRQGLAHSALVTTLYEEVLGRNADIAGFDFWVKMLARGVSEAAVASAFWNSPEHVALVASSAVSPADPAGRRAPGRPDRRMDRLRARRRPCRPARSAEARPVRSPRSASRAARRGRGRAGSGPDPALHKVVDRRDESPVRADRVTPVEPGPIAAVGDGDIQRPVFAAVGDLVPAPPRLRLYGAGQAAGRRR